MIKKYHYNKTDQNYIYEKIESWLEKNKYNCIDCWFIYFNVYLSKMKDSIICFIQYDSNNIDLKDFETTFILKPRFYNYFDFTKKELNKVWNYTKNDLKNFIEKNFKCICD